MPTVATAPRVTSYSLGSRWKTPAPKWRATASSASRAPRVCTRVRTAQSDEEDDAGVDALRDDRAAAAATVADEDSSHAGFVLPLLEVVAAPLLLPTASDLASLARRVTMAEFSAPTSDGVSSGLEETKFTRFLITLSAGLCCC